jgi:hypothetical protein
LPEKQNSRPEGRLFRPWPYQKAFKKEPKESEMTVPDSSYRDRKRPLASEIVVQEVRRKRVSPAKPPWLRLTRYFQAIWENSGYPAPALLHVGQTKGYLNARLDAGYAEETLRHEMDAFVAAIVAGEVRCKPGQPGFMRFTSWFSGYRWEER